MIELVELVAVMVVIAVILDHFRLQIMTDQFIYEKCHRKDTFVVHSGITYKIAKENYAHATKYVRRTMKGH